MVNARNLLANVSPKGKLALGGSILGVLLLAVLMVRLAAQPSYATLMSGVDPAQTGKITAALDERGIRYELQNNGTAIAVDKEQTAQARVALAEQGLAGGGGDKPGFELFDKQKLGASDFQQKVSYQRALEGEIARTVEQVQGVSGAQVQLVLPEDELFADEQSPATAAVLLSGGAGTLDPASVRGIAQLVSSSVKGLKPENVSITGSTGELLWPKDGAVAGGESGGGATPKQAADNRYEQALEGQLNAMLAQTLGPQKARVQVKADVDADQATRDSLRYTKKGVPLERQTEKETLKGAGGAAGGAAGTAGNIPHYAQEGGDGRSSYKRATESTKMGVGKDVTRTKIAPGTVNRQAVSLVLDASVPPGTVPEIRRAVESAAGIDLERGDALSVSQFPFAQPKGEHGPDAIANLVDYAKYAALGLAVLLFLLFVARHLRRRELELLDTEPTWLRDIDAPTPIAELETRELVPEPVSEEVTERRMRDEIDSLVTEEPGRAAQQVRAWMQEE
ncbi:MAG: flagellar M-ring protein FliF [Actinomycetota bacterium]|nr:flagellar M-ring protein FliF [Actinomycetota bacterium]